MIIFVTIKMIHCFKHTNDYCNNQRLRNENVFRKVDVFHTRSPILTPYDVAKNYFEAISNFSIYYGQLPHNFTSVISTFVLFFGAVTFFYIQDPVVFVAKLLLSIKI